MRAVYGCERRDVMGLCARLSAVCVIMIGTVTTLQATQRFSRICPKCGYALTGLPEPCRCPECGHEVDAMHRSVEVWPSTGKPAWAQTIFLAGFCFLIAVGAVSSWRDGDYFITSLCAVAVVGFGAGTLSEARKLVLMTRHKTTAWLHFSPNGVGMTNGRSFSWYEWSEVDRVTLRNASWGREWMLSIEGGWEFLGARSVKLIVTLPRSKRLAARVRNTLRRHLSVAKALRRSGR